MTSPHRSIDPEAPVDDVIEQEQEVVAEEPETVGLTPTLRRRDPELPEADALDQARDVGGDDYEG